MDSLTQIWLYTKRATSRLCALASGKRRKESRTQAILRRIEEAEMGISVCDVQRLVSREGDTIAPCSPCRVAKKL